MIQELSKEIIVWSRTIKIVLIPKIPPIRPVYRLIRAVRHFSKYKDSIKIDGKICN